MQGSRPGIPSEYFQKVPKVKKTGVQTYVHDRKICGFQKGNCLPDPVIIDVFRGSPAKGFFKKSAEILLVHVGKGSKVTDINLFSVMVSNKDHGGFDQLYPCIGVAVRIGIKVELE